MGFGSTRTDTTSGVYIVDVTRPDAPQLVSTTNTIPGFDVKVWRHYVYSVNGRPSGDGGILDISDPANPQLVGSFPSAHNIFIDENGFMYLSVIGVRIFDLNDEPTEPRLVWSGGNEGHDTFVTGNRLYDFHGLEATNIYDISDPIHPQLLNSIDATFIVYNHSGCPTEDGKFLLICDELGDKFGAPADITVWDISDIDNPRKVDEYANATATVHNLFIKGDYAYASYYTAGFCVFDVSEPNKIKLMAEYDTCPTTGETFEGAFGVYPFAPSGNIYISDKGTGLYIFSFSPGSGSSKSVLSP